MTKRGDGEPPGHDKPAGGAANPRPQAEAFPMHEHIGRQLRSMFEDVVAQPVPDRLQKLLEELERKRSKD
jgi:hypothetical protein